MKRVFDTVTGEWVNVVIECKFEVWIVTDGGKTYTRLIEEVRSKEDNIMKILKVVDALP